MPGWTYIKSFDELNDYDFIIFSSAGSNTDIKAKKQNKSPWWVSELQKINTPFAVQCHNEIDEAIMPFREFFLVINFLDYFYQYVKIFLEKCQILILMYIWHIRILLQ